MSNQQKMTEIYRNQNKTKYDPPKVKVSSVYIYFVYSHNKSFDQRTDYWIHCKNEHTTTFVVVTTTFVVVTERSCYKKT